VQAALATWLKGRSEVSGVEVSGLLDVWHSAW